MKKLLIFAFLGTLNVGTGQTATLVTGVIDSDTEWTKEYSPYTLTGNILVSKGVTLTIEDGTTINLNGRYIMVNGTLAAKGTSTNQITFQGGGAYGGKIVFTESSVGWNEHTEIGSIIDNTHMNQTFLELSGSPRINNNLIEHSGIDIKDGSPTISNNKFYASQIEIAGGSPVISGNDLPGGMTAGFEVNYFTPITIDGGSPVISKNTIYDAEMGIEIKQGNPYIYGNNVSSSQPNIRANAGLIERNYFEGIIEIGNVTVKNNTINAIMVKGSSSPTIAYNNVVSIHLSSSTNVDATNNWWGTADPAEIDQKIWDYNDDYSLGEVNYTPFLTEPNAQAMPDPNAPTPTPEQTPTFTPTPPPTSSPSTSPTPSQEPRQTELTAIAGAIIIATIIGAGLGLLLYLIKRD